MFKKANKSATDGKGDLRRSESREKGSIKNTVGNNENRARSR